MQVMIKLICWPIMMLLTIASTGVVVNGHFCQDKLMHIVLFVPTEKCGEACEGNSSNRYDLGNALHFIKAKCCQQISVIYKVDVVAKVLTQASHNQTLTPIPSFKLKISKSLETNENQLVLANWHPPNFWYGLSILSRTQCFLI